MCALKEDSINYYLFCTYYLPDSSISALHVLSCFSVTLLLEGECFYNSQFKDGETETHGNKKSNAVTKLIKITGEREAIERRCRCLCFNQDSYTSVLMRTCILKNFNSVFYLTLYIQNILISTYNQIKLLDYFTFSSQ